MKRKYSAIIKIIARQEGVSPEYVYSQMQKAIEAGYNNPDPDVQDIWRAISPDGVPSPERLIGMLSNGVKKK